VGCEALKAPAGIAVADAARGSPAFLEICRCQDSVKGGRKTNMTNL
jgi:hypothetical protein